MRYHQRRVQIAVIGLGSIGRRHRDNFRALGCDVRTFDILDSLDLEGCQGAVIATPPESHVELAWKALGAGCHLMIEKPVSTTLNELGHLFAACDRANRVHMVAYPWRYDPVLHGKKARIAELGPILSFGCWYTYDTGNATALKMGALLDCSHAVDLLRWLLGEPATLCANISAQGLVADVDIRFAAGGLGRMHVSLTEPLCCEWTIVGEHGAVDWKRTRDVQDINAMYIAEAAHFLACIDYEAVPLTTGWDAYDTLRVCLAAERSHAEQRWISR